MPNRLPIRDPRTVARDIPGILDIIFPRLSGALVSAMNRNMIQFACAQPVPGTLLADSTQQRSTLFEIAVTLAESVLRDGRPLELTDCVEIALQRQRRHYDASDPQELSETDKKIIEQVSRNLVNMLKDFALRRNFSEIVIRPNIPGFSWIGSGVGDFAIGNVLIEVKNTDRNFIASDYRQILLYWLLVYARSMETNEPVWDNFLLINPRLNRSVYKSFDSVIQAASGGLNRLEVHEYLRAVIVGSKDTQK